MRSTLVAGLALAVLAACGQKAEEKKAVPPPALITVTQATKGDFEVVLETLGTLEVLADPKVGAEVAGRVTQVLARTGTRVKVMPVAWRIAFRLAGAVGISVCSPNPLAPKGPSGSGTSISRLSMGGTSEVVGIR